MTAPKKNKRKIRKKSARRTEHKRLHPISPSESRPLLQLVSLDAKLPLQDLLGNFSEQTGANFG